MSVSSQLTSFIESEITPGRDFGSLDPEDDLLARGIIDSLGVAQLASFISERYGVVVGEEDFVPSNFQTISRIERFILRKRGLRPC
jgi:acyl carrier protein